LVVRPGALGDVLLTLPALQALISACGAQEIELLGNLAMTEWLVGRSVITGAESFDRRDLGALFLRDSPLPATLTEYLSRFDLIVNYASGPGQVLALNLARASRGRILDLDARPTDWLTEHMSDYLHTPLLRLGVPTTRQAPEINLLACDREAAASWLSARAAMRREIIAIHPGSGSTGKNWPAERFARLADHLQRNRRAQVLLIGGPADHEAVDAVIKGMRSAPVLHINEPGLPLLAALMERCQAFVGNDSGVSHLAAALRMPSVVLFGPTDPAVWAPRGSDVTILKASLECSPCTAGQRRSCGARRCLTGLSFDEVLRATSTALQRGGTRQAGQAG
jgi:ADP-heptose:LPS heptosyltransferase